MDIQVQKEARARDAREKVANGVKVLSEMDPHWYDKTDLDRFDMESPLHDILAQLYGGYSVGMERVATHLELEWCVDLFGAEYGFNETSKKGRARLSDLQEEWERVIRKLVG